MKCTKVHKRLLAYLDGELNEDQTKNIREHLETCQSCHAIVVNSQNAWKTVRDDKIPHQPFFYTRLKQRMENRQVKSSPVISRLGKVLLQPALYFTVLALGIFIGVQLGQGIHPPYEATMQTEQTNYLENYAKSQYLNGMELEVIEQELFTEELDKKKTNNE